MLNYLGKLKQTIRNKDSSLERILKVELFRKNVPKVHNDCDSHLVLANLINKIGGLLIKVWFVKTWKFDELRFETLLIELAVDEDKGVIETCIKNLGIYGTIHGSKPLSFQTWNWKITIFSYKWMINSSV